ncbi:hypothetical protein FOCC_FOCC005587 [Frankliniella occidentalis]|nr:hypothetical protein FOCC_FOCC005587 [Frankliniella occidentalis]
MTEDLAQLCNHVQRHTKCRKGFCLRKKNRNSQYACKYNFPKDLNAESHLEIIDNCVSDIIFKRNDPYLNKFNDWTLQTWRANIDFSPIFSETVVYRYIAKYASKSEVKSETYNAIMTQILDKRCVEGPWDRYSKRVTRDEVQIIDEYIRRDVEFGFLSTSTFENLNSEQVQFLNFIKYRINTIVHHEDVKSVFTILQGMPGTGKSYLLKACVKCISDVLGMESVKVLAPTGVAAKNVEGQTLHSFLLLGKIGFSMRTLNGEELLNYRNKYSSIKFLFIDECSMVGLRMLSCVERRCREIMDNDLLFGGINIILVGDFNQLLPISDQPLYAEIDMLTQQNSLLERGKLLMGEVTHAMVLEECHRFASNEYVNFLRKVSTGECCEGDVNDDMADGLVNVLILKKNAKVMLKRNINVRRGLVNGAVGFVQYIIYEQGKKPPSIPLCILVKFDDVLLDDMDINLVPILPCTSMWYKNGITCSRYQLPLVLCWACTVHRAQGLTLKSMILDAGCSEFALGLLYVALSRVSDKENLCLIMALTLQRLNSVKRSSRYEIRTKFLKKLHKMSQKFISY